MLQIEQTCFHPLVAPYMICTNVCEDNNRAKGNGC